MDFGFVSDLVSDRPSTWLRAVSLSNRKEHLATDAGRISDSHSELITAVSVTPGNVADSDEFIGLVDPGAGT